MCVVLCTVFGCGCVLLNLLYYCCIVLLSCWCMFVLKTMIFKQQHQNMSPQRDIAPTNTTHNTTHNTTQLNTQHMHKYILFCTGMRGKWSEQQQHTMQHTMQHNTQHNTTQHTTQHNKLFRSPEGRGKWAEQEQVGIEEVDDSHPYMQCVTVHITTQPPQRNTILRMLNNTQLYNATRYRTQQRNTTHRNQHNTSPYNTTQHNTTHNNIT